MAVRSSGNVRITGTAIDDQKVTFQKIVSLSFESDRFTPADELQFTVLDVLNGRFKFITMELNGRKIFDGIVDIQKRVIDQKGNYTSFVCRRKTCMMLDNEVKPYWYFNLTSDQLIKSHALPYGANGAKLPKAAVLPQILAKKGISHWEFLTLFCRLAYHRSPYVDRMGNITCDPFQETEHLFSNSRADGIPFLTAELTDDHYQIISKLSVKTGKAEYGATYGYVLNNASADQFEIVRERYYHPETEWQGEPALSARQYYEDKQAGFFEVTVTVPGIYDIRAGDSARFEDVIGSYYDLYVTTVRLRSDSDGNTMTITLWEKSGLINR